MQNPAEAFEREIEENEPALELLAAKDANWHWLRYPYLREGDTVEKRRAVRAYLQAQRVPRGAGDAGLGRLLVEQRVCAVRGEEGCEVDCVAAVELSEHCVVSIWIWGGSMAKLVYGHDINHVLLLHLGAFSSTILPDALDLLEKKGFTLVTLEEAESDPAYEADPDAGSKYGGTLLEQWMDARKIKYPPVAEKPYKELAEICK